MLHDPDGRVVLPRRHRRRHRPIGSPRPPPARYATSSSSAATATRCRAKGAPCNRAPRHRRPAPPCVATDRSSPSSWSIVVVAAIVVVTRQERQLDRERLDGHDRDRRLQPGRGRLRGARPRPQGTTKSIDWGSRCDTTQGHAWRTRASSPARATRPFKGDNGGATSPGVTGDSIKVVLYQAAGARSDPEVHRGRRSPTPTPTPRPRRPSRTGSTSTRPTTRPMAARSSSMPFTATGSAADEVAARADATQIAEIDQALRRDRRPGAHHRVRRRARRAPDPVPRLHARPAEHLLRRALALRVRV